MDNRVNFTGDWSKIVFLNKVYTNSKGIALLEIVESNSVVDDIFNFKVLTTKDFIEKYNKEKDISYFDYMIEEGILRTEEVETINITSLEEKYLSGKEYTVNSDYVSSIDNIVEYSLSECYVDVTGYGAYSKFTVEFSDNTMEVNLATDIGTIPLITEDNGNLLFNDYNYLVTSTELNKFSNYTILGNVTHNNSDYTLICIDKEYFMSSTETTLPIIPSILGSLAYLSAHATCSIEYYKVLLSYLFGSYKVNSTLGYKDRIQDSIKCNTVILNAEYDRVSKEDRILIVKDLMKIRGAENLDECIDLIARKYNLDFINKWVVTKLATKINDSINDTLLSLSVIDTLATVELPRKVIADSKLYKLRTGIYIKNHNTNINRKTYLTGGLSLVKINMKEWFECQ